MGECDYGYAEFLGDAFQGAADFGDFGLAGFGAVAASHELEVVHYCQLEAFSSLQAAGLGSYVGYGGVGGFVYVEWQVV